MDCGRGAFFTNALHNVSFFRLLRSRGSFLSSHLLQREQAVAWEGWLGLAKDSPQVKFGPIDAEDLCKPFGL